GADGPNRSGSQPYSSIHSFTESSTSERSTDEASNSKTTFRAWRTASESVSTTIPSSTLREHEGTRARLPSTSTTHTRQTLTGVRVGAQHIVGCSSPIERQASRIVLPSGTVTWRPSIDRLTNASFTISAVIG